jgi:hypothetical protein
MGILKLGDISIDGTKIKANASKHKAMSWDYACKLEVQLRNEVEELTRRAESESGKASKRSIFQQNYNDGKYAWQKLLKSKPNWSGEQQNDSRRNKPNTKPN